MFLADMHSVHNQVVARVGHWMLGAALVAVMVVGCSGKGGQPTQYETNPRLLKEADKTLTICSRNRLNVGAFRKAPHSRILMVRMGAANLRVTLLAPSGASPNQLGDELLKILGHEASADEIEVTDGRPFVIASRFVSNGHWGMLRSRDTYDFAPLVRALGETTDAGRVFVRVPLIYESATQGLIRLPDSGSHAVYTPAPGAVRISSTVDASFGPGVLGRLLAAVGLPIGVFLLVPLLGWAISRGKAPIEKRRLRYVWLAYPASILGLFLIVPISMLSKELASDWQCVELLAVWSGSRSVSVTAVGLALMLLPASALFGELYCFPPRPSKDPKWKAWFAAIWPDRFLWGGSFIGATVAQIATGASGPPTSIFILMPMLVSWGTTPDLGETRPAPDLLETATKIGEFFGVVVDNVAVFTGKLGWKMTNAFALRSKTIVVTGKAYAEFNFRQLQFLLAHEVAHFTRFPNPQARSGPVQFAFGSLYSFALISLITGLSGWSSWVFAACCFIVPFALAIPSGRKDRELECAVDADALRYTRDLDAALSVLDTLDGPSPRWEWAVGHPTKEKRIASLKKHAAELGLS